MRGFVDIMQGIFTHQLGLFSTCFVVPVQNLREMLTALQVVRFESLALNTLFTDTASAQQETEEKENCNGMTSSVNYKQIKSDHRGEGMGT